MAFDLIIRRIRRHKKLRDAIEQEVFRLRRFHGDRARAAALEKLQRPDLTSWGRQVFAGAAKRL